ncbi:unnamed protein product [Larinioides sclopetarius]|uniref:Uncharacterized protein n=1 Tax=Larinioides sclopetarius TaxID=280406 RepID=A0AAV2BT54_9ARAC
MHLGSKESPQQHIGAFFSKDSSVVIKFASRFSAKSSAIQYDRKSFGFYGIMKWTRCAGLSSNRMLFLPSKMTFW